MAERISGYQTVVKWANLTAFPSTYANSTELGVAEWAFTINNDLVDVSTTTDDGYRYFIPGLRGTEGSVTFWHEDATSLPFDSGDRGKFEFYLDSVNTTSNYTVPCTIGSIEITGSNDGGVQVVANFNGRGAISGTLA